MPNVDTLFCHQLTKSIIISLLLYLLLCLLSSGCITKLSFRDYRKITNINRQCQILQENGGRRFLSGSYKRILEKNISGLNLKTYGIF